MNNPKAKSLPYGSELVIRVVLGRYAQHLINQINLWLNQSGTEWTVSRLKAYWAAAKQLRAGNRSVTKSIYQENSIAYYKGTLLPRGPFKRPVEMFLLAQRPLALRRASAVLRAYTALTLETVSRSQLSKARKAINGVSTANEKLITKLSALLDKWVSAKLPSHNHTLKNVDLRRLKAFTSCHRMRSGGKETRERPYGLFVASLLTSCYIPEPLTELLDWELDEFRQILIESGADADASGHIAFIQENGAKCRVVAVPNAWIQLIYEPLHIYLDDLIQGLPGSAMHDQNQGAYYVQQSLASSKKLYCFDLSSATDRFPLALQTQLLESLGFSEHAEGIRRLSDGWEAKVNGSQEPMWGYTVGQPMGLYGSFPLFHLTHLALLDIMSRQVRAFTRDSRPFLVLGDDVLIRDRELSDLYKRVMVDLGVEISASKSITSSKVAEFAGFVGIKTNKSVAVFRPYKHGVKGRIHAPINLMNTVGSDMSKYGSSWTKLAIQFQSSRAWRNPDLSPLISKDERRAEMAPKLDSTRLSSLLKLMLNSLHPDMSLEDEFDDSNLLERVVFRLLGKEPGLDVDNRSISGLSEPTRCEEVKQEPAIVIAQRDPLLSEIRQREESLVCVSIGLKTNLDAPPSLCRLCEAVVCPFTGTSPDRSR